MQGFSQHKGKPEIHASHDPGGEKEPKSNKQWEMSQSLFILVIYFVRAICSMNEQIKGELLWLLFANLIFHNLFLLIFYAI